MPKAKRQHGTTYRYGGLLCGCVRALTGPEVSAADPEEPLAGCIRGDAKPKRHLVLWVALPGVHVKPHRCCDGPPPPPPGSLWNAEETGIPATPEAEKNPSTPSTLNDTGTQEGQPPQAAMCEMKGGQIAWLL